MTKPEEATEDREAAKNYLDSIYPAKDFANPYNYTMVIAEHSKSFIAGILHERSRRAAPRDGVDREKVLEAIEAEPELPGEIPFEMFHAFKHANKETMAEMLRIIVRQTKAGIKERFLASQAKGAE